jgi:hypothetical protein
MGASPSVLPDAPPRVAMESHPRECCWHGFGNGNGASPDSEFAIEPNPINSHDSHDCDDDDVTS